MADHNPDSDSTPRTLLRRVLDTADPRTPRRPRSARAGAQRRALLETASSRRLSSQTKMTTRRYSHRVRSISGSAYVQASGHLEEQTPRTLLKNILLTAPESSILMPKSVVKPVPAPQEVQPSRRESSVGSLELQLPELEPPTTLAPGLLAPGRRKQRLRLSMFQQGVDQGLPLSQDIVLEDTQPFSQPTVGCSRRVYRSLPCMPHTGAKDAELAAGCKTRSSGPGMQTNSPEKPAQFLAGEAEEVDAFALDFLSTSSGVSGEDGVEPLQDGVEEAEKRMEEEGVSVSEMEATGAQGPSRAEEPEGHTQVIEAEESQETAEAKGPGASSGDEDASDRAASPELVSSTPESLQARRHHQFLEPDPPPGAAVLSSEPAEPLLVRRPPKPGTTGPRPQQDPHKAGLSHYVKLFSFYAKMPMERKALEMVEKCLDKYFQHLCDDLEVFAAHAGRKTVNPEDVELLMRRQGLVTDQVSLHVLVERYLPLEYRQLLIPCASSGNSVFPAQ
uniref:centromere protein T isoform X2 n=1 Tax=Callithrix jacchus TaxID=9483 RepID=UPI0023DD2197|nr:centromere protein T isoform X2 [Callithrix jacchus]